MAELWTKAWPILLAILFFGIIIMVHEAGHFLAAKAFKVKVHKFALGMGPRILHWGKGETEYSLRLFPVGGYCLMEGEDEESDADNDRAVNNKPVWQRMIIMAAGACMNLLLGLIVLAVMLGTSEAIPARTVVQFAQDAQTQSVGLRVGDRFLEINGKHVFNSSDVGYLMSRQRDGKYDVVVDRAVLDSDGNDTGAREKVQINGLQLTVTEEDGHPVLHNDFWLGWAAKTPKNVFEGTFRNAASLVQTTYLSLFDMVTGQYKLSDMSGPIGIADTISQVASDTKPDPDTGKVDLSTLYYILALITVNIGIMNLLPLPALDGGRLFFLLLNWILPKKWRIPQKYEGWVHAAGLILLLGFMAVVSFGDILKIAQR
ncbi:MAG: site-2 protease family protein [Oscillospiraceae bacterium]|jgi:regulator of sigma E protease|nr:site-2 protease family protein [Oscillospiraceae bacterium]